MPLARQAKSAGKFQHLLDHGKIILKRGAMAAKAKTLPKARTHGPMPRGIRAKSKYLQLKKTACNLDKDPILRGEALAAIRKDHLYRFELANFELFCREACGISRSHANRFINASSMWTLRKLFPRLPRNVDLLCRLKSFPMDPKPARNIRKRIWQRTLEISNEQKVKPNSRLLEKAALQVTRKCRGRRNTRVTSQDWQTFEELFSGSDEELPKLSERQLRLAVKCGLETLGALLGPKDDEACKTIQLLQTILRRLWRTTLTS